MEPDSLKAVQGGVPVVAPAVQGTDQQDDDMLLVPDSAQFPDIVVHDLLVSWISVGCPAG